MRLASRAWLALAALAALSPSGLAQDQTDLGANFGGEAERFGKSCAEFKILPCATLLFTDHPLHIAVGSLAPQNGFAAGPALALEKHTSPGKSKNRKSGNRWRLNFDVDAAVSNNLSWRAGAYVTGTFIPGHKIGVVQGAPQPGVNLDLRRKYAQFSAYAQAESLNKLIYYGQGQGTSRTGQAFYGMRETVAGVNAAWPLFQPISLTVFGEANARFVSVRQNHHEGGPSIEQRYTEATAPGLVNQPGFGQFAQGIRMEPAFLRNHVHLNYSLALQEYVAPGSKYSFQRLMLDLSHEYQIYSSSVAKGPREASGPDSCSQNSSGACPCVVSIHDPECRLTNTVKDAAGATRSADRQGAIGFRFLMTDSFLPAGNSVPFYFQPTLGGADINGQLFLPSYADYRFRGPNLMLLRASFEHSIWGPFGFTFLADEGKVGLTRGDLGFTHLAHSFATGLTLRAGGFPVVSLMFAWGGHEGTHNIALVNTALLGGSARPSLY